MVHMNAKRQVNWPSPAALTGTLPVFTGPQLAEAIRGAERKTIQSWVKYHLGEGHLKRVERGLYAVVPPGLDAETFQPDPYLVANAARRPGGMVSLLDTPRSNSWAWPTQTGMP